MEQSRLRELSIIAAKGRILGVEIVHRAASGHIGGSLSCMDIITLLYNGVMRIDPANPKDPDRDRFVLSKGHCTPALYPILAMRGYFPLEWLKEYRQITSPLSGHADMHAIPGVDMSTGSLGQGISAAVGMAIALKYQKRSSRVYAVLGDGEIEEGQVWEAAMSANKYHLDNLCAVVDVNGLQIDGPTSKVMPSEPLDAKFASFGWHVIKCSGHDFEALEQAFTEAEQTKGQPTVILAATTKGKGVDFMENDPGWHGKAPNDEQYAKADAQLRAALAELEG